MWPAVPCVALDCEASGIDPERDVIWQYAVYGTDADGGVVDVHAAVRNDDIRTGRNPRNIPGITRAEWAAATPLPDGHLDRLHRALHGAAVWCHKRAFDWELVRCEFLRHGRAPPRPLVVHCSEVLTRYRLRLPKGDLKSLCARFGITLETWHNARSDAKATFELVVKVANLYWYEWFADNDAPRWAVRSTHWPPPRPPWGWWVTTLARRPRSTTAAALAAFARRPTG